MGYYEEHRKILMEGVDAWNEWRRQNKSITPFLSGAFLGKADLNNADLKAADLRGANLMTAKLSNANLSGAQLLGANLTYANLSSAKLLWANLSDAYLSGARLPGADLSKAHLSSAKLFEADLRNANLSSTNLVGVDLRHSILIKANLSGANLSGANLIGAHLSEADFTVVILGETVLVDIDLSTIQNIESCHHLAPSVLDHRTLMRSGRLPEVFLRGCGLPDSLINYFPSLLNEQVRFHSCFISYSKKDEKFAKRLHADLQDNGVRCWFAPEDMKIGDRIRPVIDESIRVYDKLLLILTEQSIKSAWVEKEVETAFEKEQRQQQTVLFPIRLDEAVMEAKEAWAADIRRTRHIGDFCGWKSHDSYRTAFERLLRDLKATAIAKK